MSYDRELAHRIRTAVADRAGVTERPMFGGVGFMLDGNMFVGVMAKGGLLVRVGHAGHEAALAAPHAGPFEMGRGRSMAGYVLVAPPGVATQGAVVSWIERAWAHVRTLAPRTVGARTASSRKAAKLALAAGPGKPGAPRAKTAPASTPAPAAKKLAARATAKVSPKKSKPARAR